MMQQPAEKPIFWSGFLAVSLLLGTSYGFFLVEFAAVTHGYHWSSRFYIDPAITAIVCGGMVGLILGFVLDTTVSNPETRQKLAKSLWLLLIFSWFLFNLLLPGFSRARE